MSIPDTIIERLRSTFGTPTQYDQGIWSEIISIPR